MINGTQVRPEIIRVSEMANVLSLSISTVYSHINQGLLPKPFSLGAKSSGFLREEIHSLLEFISTSPSMDERRKFVSSLPSQRRSQ